MVFWRKRTKEDEAMFKRRWTMALLRKKDPDLAQALHEQEQIFVQACVTGTELDIEEHGAALCRGYLKAVRTMAGETHGTETEREGG